MQEKYAWISQHSSVYPLELMCHVLGVSRSGYLNSLKRPISARSINDFKLLLAIKTAHQQGRGVYGAAKIQAELADQGIKVGLNRIKRLRRLHGISCIHKRKFKATTQSNHKMPVADNILNRGFDSTTAPNQVWLTDITYVDTHEGWLYLAGVKDAHTCELVGWSMSSTMTKRLVIDALRMAYQRKKPTQGLIHHSDRGSQYCSKTYYNLLKTYNMTPSMSRKGNCWDNAPMESFFASLKTECVYQQRLKTREQAKTLIFDYIEVFYNNQRRHQSLNYMTPANFSKQHYQNLQKLVA